MGNRRHSNVKYKARMKACWERSKLVTRPARKAKNDERAATNISLGNEPAYRHGGEYKDSRGRVKGTRRDTAAWTASRLARKASRAWIGELSDKELARYRDARYRGVPYVPGKDELDTLEEALVALTGA